jgi:hypothetical protein
MKWNLRIINKTTGFFVETTCLIDSTVFQYKIDDFIEETRHKGEHFSVHIEVDYDTGKNETMVELPKWISKFLFPLKMEEKETQEIYATARDLIRIQQVCRDFNMLDFIKESEIELFKFRSIFSKDDKYTFPTNEIIQAALNRMIEKNSCYCVMRFELVDGEIIRFSTGIIDTEKSMFNCEDGYYKYDELLTFNGKGEIIFNEKS